MNTRQKTRKTKDKQDPRTDWQYWVEYSEKRETYTLYGDHREVLALGQPHLHESLYLQFQKECNVLGCMLLANEDSAVTECQMLLTEESFVHPVARRLYVNALKWQAGEQEGSLLQESCNNSEAIRFASYCLELHQSSASFLKSHVKALYLAHRDRQYAAIMRKDAERRKKGEQGSSEMETLLQAELQIWRESDLLNESSCLADSLIKFMQDMEENMKGEATAMIRTGIQELDDAIGGLMESDYIVLGGRPGSGKTSMAMNTAANICERGGAVVVFSLEMTEKQLIARLIQQFTGVSSKWLLSGDPRLMEHFPRISAAVSNIGEWNLKIYDHAGLEDVEQAPALVEKARRSMGVEKIDLVVFDHLGEATKNAIDKQAETTRKSGILRNLAKHSGIPVLTLVQMNRSIEKGGKSDDGKLQRLPQNSDLRDAGEIEEQASVILFTHNQEQVVIGKDRFGTPSVVDVPFVGQYTRWGSA